MSTDRPLLPCPFSCDPSGGMEPGFTPIGVTCPRCGCTGPVATNPALMAEKWNRRPPTPGTPAATPTALELLLELREDASHCPFCMRVECADDCRLLAVIRPSATPGGTPVGPQHIDLTCQHGGALECRWPGHPENAHLRSHPAWAGTKQAAEVAAGTPMGPAEALPPVVPCPACAAVGRVSAVGAGTFGVECQRCKGQGIILAPRGATPSVSTPAARAPVDEEYEITMGIARAGVEMERRRAATASTPMGTAAPCETCKARHEFACALWREWRKRGAGGEPSTNSTSNQSKMIGSGYLGPVANSHAQDTKEKS